LVSIMGSNFVDGLTVSFGTSNAVAVNFGNSTLITVVSPTHPVGTVNVTVQNPDLQSATSTNAFVFETPVLPPFQILSVSLLDADSIKIIWESSPAAVYEIQTRDTLASTNWTSLGMVTSASTTTSFTNAGVATNVERFYRVGRLP
jgi:hypothetical protein